jgi:hypothetical protein
MQRRCEGTNNTIDDFMLISLGDAPIHAYQCGQKIKLIFLETTYFSGMVCLVRVLAPAKSTIAPFRLISLMSGRGQLVDVGIMHTVASY